MKPRDCQHTSYYPDGKTIHVVENYADDKLDGSRTVYYRNGSPCLEEHYVVGERHGLCTMYHEDGSLIYTKDYVNGEIVGLPKVYWATG